VWLYISTSTSLNGKLGIPIEKTLLKDIEGEGINKTANRRKGSNMFIFLQTLESKEFDD
jgi:hypothetical protein